MKKNRIDIENDFVIDESLDFYNDKVLFPDKLKKANEMLKRSGLPLKALIDSTNAKKEQKKACQIEMSKTAKVLGSVLQQNQYCFLREAGISRYSARSGTTSLREKRFANTPHRAPRTT